MRISDWSSDVCSSDLERLLHIKASPRGSLSRSAMVASRLLARLQETDVEPLDLFDADLPPFGGAVIEGRYALLSGQPVAEDAAADRSEEHTSELQSLMRISYAVFCLKKKKTNNRPNEC